MSEELIKRGLAKHGMPFGPYEFYNIGSTTIRTLRQYKIVPRKPYEGFLNNQPDGLLVDRRDLNNIPVIAVVENKAPDEFNTPEKKDQAVEQCVVKYCKPLDAKVGIVTDRNEYIWVNPQFSGKRYETILREDGYPLHLPFVWGNATEVEQTLQVLEKVLADISPTSSQLKEEELQNPSNLADRVWQTIWLASGENPDMCLATFVEIFVFKYLSDLRVLVKDDAGIGISFYDTLAIDRDKCLIFYFARVRPHIRTIFPPSSEDGTSIINSTVLDFTSAF